MRTRLLNTIDELTARRFMALVVGFATIACVLCYTIPVLGWTLLTLMNVGNALLLVEITNEL